MDPKRGGSVGSLVVAVKRMPKMTAVIQCLAFEDVGEGVCVNQPMYADLYVDVPHFSLFLLRGVNVEPR